MSIKYYGYVFRSSIFLLIFCLVVLLVAAGGWGLKSPAIVGDLSVSSFSSISFYFMYFETMV